MKNLILPGRKPRSHLIQNIEKAIVKERGLYPNFFGQRYSEMNVLVTIVIGKEDLMVSRVANALLLNKAIFQTL